MAPHRRLVRMLLACIFGMALVLLAAVPAAAGTEPPFIAIRGIEYAPRIGNAHVPDLYLPRHRRGRVPVAIWSAGSAWLGDNGNQGGDVLAERFTPHGFAVAAVRSVPAPRHLPRPGARRQGGRALAARPRAALPRIQIGSPQWATPPAGGWRRCWESPAAWPAWRAASGHGTVQQGPGRHRPVWPHQLPPAGRAHAARRLRHHQPDLGRDRLPQRSAVTGVPVRGVPDPVLPPAVARQPRHLRQPRRPALPDPARHRRPPGPASPERSAVPGAAQGLRRGAPHLAGGPGPRARHLDETAPPFTPRSTRVSRGCGPVRTFTGPPVTWDALVRYLTRALAGQDHQAADGAGILARRVTVH
jgi:hypothetical protein